MLGVGLEVSGLIANTRFSPVQDPFDNSQVFARYVKSDALTLRFGLGFSGGSSKTLVTDSVGAALQNFDSTNSQFNGSILFGIEKHFETNNRLDPYIGAEVLLGRIGNTKIRSKLSLEDTTGIFRSQTDEDYLGGIQFGIGGLVGFNYFVAKQFAIGAEYSLSYQHTSVGGDFNIVTITTPVSGNSTTDRSTGSLVERQNTLGIKSNLNVRITYFFGTRKRDG